MLGPFLFSPVNNRWICRKLLGALLVLSVEVDALPQVGAEDAKAAFRVEKGLTVELVATEPVVRSPSAIAWDESGRLFVAENTGYPVGPKLGEAPMGKVVELRDANGDGRAEERIEFATDLDFPNGLMPWRGGWLVTDAPNLFWLADTNHDGRADLREVWFTGFATNQSTQLRACYPVLGPDGWIYVARGWSGGVITSPKWPELTAVDLKGGDFRFRPDGSKAEAIGGNAQFGMVLDDVGRRFLTSNRNPIMHAVARPQWWRRMPNFYFTEVVQDVSPVGAAAKVFPISADLTTSGFMPELMSAPHAGTFTSACGLHQFFGEGLPADFQGSWFICEPAQNLVQRQIMTAEGASFRSRRATEGADFLASSDTWFHPVYAATGPDGALYIADMYRKFIDHPEYLPKAAREKFDFEAGRERGRVWRIVSEKAKVVSGLTNASPRELVQGLTSDNIWRRQTAHRLILERPTDALVLELVKLFEPPAAAKGEKPEDVLTTWAAARREQDSLAGPHLGRARAVWLLQDLILNYRKALRIETANKAVHPILLSSFDPSPSVREAMFRAYTEISNEHNPIPDVGGGAMELWMNDPSAAVRFQFAYSLGQGDYSRMTEVLVTILRRDAADRWTRAVVLSGLSERMHEFAEKWFATKWSELPGTPPNPVGFTETEASAALAFDMARVYARHVGFESTLIRQALDESADETAWQAALLTGFLEAGHRELRQKSLDDERFARLAEHNATNAVDRSLPLYKRVAAVRFLGEMPGEGREALLELVTRTHPKELQIVAARALAKSADFPPALFEEWRSFGPELREIFIEALVSKPHFSLLLLDAVERGEIPAWNINANRKRALLGNSSPAVRDRAEALLGRASAGDRGKAFEEAKPALAFKGDATKGRAVFLNLCASCHQHKSDGHKVGPDLTAVKNQPAEALLYHIVVPDAEIYAGFQNYEVETKTGDYLSGLLADENGAAITLVRALGEKQRIERGEIARMRMSASSLMPSELERAMTRQELADLIAFLKQ